MKNKGTLGIYNKIKLIIKGLEERKCTHVKVTEYLFNKTMEDNFPNPRKDKYRTPNRKDHERSTQHNITVNQTLSKKEHWTLWERKIKSHTEEGTSQ